MDGNRARASKTFGRKSLRIPALGQRWSWGLGIALGVGGAMLMQCDSEALLQSADRTFAQITPDSTLGVENSVVTPNATVRGFPAELIQGGATRGTNLFHSFQDFNIGNGERVYFANPTGIENILSRVTGNNLSNILGTLGVDGGANLFFLNPNGIIFGENARLDISGSFVASTANALVFENGTSFSATNPEAPPLLKISITPGLQYGANQPRATISNSGNLAVGQDLTLSAGNLDLQGQLSAGRDLKLLAQNTVKVRDSAVNPFIAASGGNLLVQGIQGVDIFALNHLDSGLFSGGNMVLRSANTVGGDAHYWSGGSFRIEQLDGSLGNLYSPYDPIIRSLGDVSFFRYQGTSLHILAGGEVNIGTVIITGAETGAAGVDYLQETVPLSNGTEVSINGSLQPTLDIRAGVAPAFIGVPRITGYNFPRDRFFGGVFRTNKPTSADITIGDVWIVPPNGLVFITNQYQPNTALPGGEINVTGAGMFGGGINATNMRGDGSSVILDSRRDITITNSAIDSSSNAGRSGDITLLANETVSLTNSIVFSNTVRAGKGGDINIQARQLQVTDGAQVSATTFGKGDGGSVIVNASEAVQLIGTSVDGRYSSVLATETVGTGKGGNVQITTPWLLVKDGAGVSVNAAGEGKGGNLIVNASQAVQLSGTTADGRFPSGLFGESSGTGEGGNVQITTPWLLVTDGGRVSVNAGGDSKGGNLIVNAPQAVQLMGASADGHFSSGLFAGTIGTGDGGNLQITTPWLLVKDGARVNVSTGGEGDGGHLIINASQAVQLIGTSSDGEFPSGLIAETESRGEGGNVQITTPWLLVTDGAVASATTGGEGKGGSLIVNASEQVQLIGTSANALFRSGLFAGTIGTGDGGSVQITTPLLLVKDGALVNVSTESEGKGGSLIVNAPQAVQLSGTTADGQFGSGLFAQTSSKGDGGNVEITTPQLLVTDGAQMSAATFGKGHGGSLIVDAPEKIQLSGTGGLFVDATAGGTAGGLTVKTNKMSVTNGAQVTVSSPLGQAGNLNITAHTLTLNRGTLSAVTGTSSPEGGANIILKGLEFLRMDNESLISASALGNANGGNVTIDSTLIVATPPTGPEGSDIIANAEEGNGGRVNITTQGLFGIQFRPQRTPKNDITVSSTFGLSGEYVLNTPGVDPSRGLAPLPTNVVDASQQIDRRCTPADRTREGSSFIITGRGGLPPNPNEPLQGDSAIAPSWVSLDPEKENNTPPIPTTPPNSTPKQLVEANGWIINEQGQVVLTAASPTMTPQSVWIPESDCNPPQTNGADIRALK
ncbi:MAG: hypothetical protein Fur006_42430 [Coleofasciculaceae cyanobacterium]